MLILASTFSGAAVASISADSTPAVMVRFADLDLNSTADVTTLYKRIRRAAFQVCVVPQQGRELAAARIARECRRSSMGRAVQQVGVPALIEMHQKKIGAMGNPVRTADNR
jgi:UrcA family protein